MDKQMGFYSLGFARVSFILTTLLQSGKQMRTQMRTVLPTRIQFKE
ncbi:hypothetical protein O987_09185 [Comamonas testosteroni TK102]|uniref:Uncharacterized protein n=1 Tax=Comamonas testosteroni TK102 TaxID=1392005 RepID=A0A076PRH4_COMTE|nr:hypothetical protein O987_09185 [Comamonas testosteroni TK102]